ncbi:SurA N-terminal domain-containing protein [Aestuariivirga sp.]|uniref:SurA N-terminal domain-containing protein n=1 Tax=Aestuariivirga sp. TaxID=2650926 RepID=UPI003BABE99F
MRRLAAAAAAVFLALSPLGGVAPALAASASIVALVNDQPITELDLSQRIVLLEVLGDLPQGGMSKQKALQELIDDEVKLVEAGRFNMLPSDADVTDRIDRIAKNLKLTKQQLIDKLKAKGITEKSFRRYLAASMGFSRIINGKYKDDMEATDAEVDAKLAEIKAKFGDQMSKIMNDPRMKPITVYSLMEILLPVDGDDPMLLQSRAIEAQQVAQRLKGCGSLKAASEGIFNVKPGKKFEADAARVPPQMRQALEQAGQGHAIGPMRGKGGIQLIAWCGVRKLTPPKPDFKMPDREQARRIVINEKYDKIEEDYLKTAREKLYVEYRDPSYAQQ